MATGDLLPNGRAKALHLDINVNSTEEDVMKIVLQLRPHWKQSNVDIKPVTGGLLNTIWRAIHNKEDPVEDPEEDMIAVKIYGAMGDALMDRIQEKKLMETLHNQGVSLPLYAIFQNGYATKFAAGRNPTREEVLSPKFRSLVIEDMHQIHTVKIEKTTTATMDAMIQNFVDSWNANSQNEALKQKVETHIQMPMEEFTRDVSQILELSSSLGEEFPKCFCHNDIHPLNIIYNSQRGDVSVIDWETACVSVEVSDMASFFGTYYSASPTNRRLYADHRDYIEEFVREYLSTHPQYKGQTISEETINKWLMGTYKAMYVVGLCNNLYSLLEDSEELLQLAVAQWDGIKDIRDMLRSKDII